MSTNEKNIHENKSPTLADCIQDSASAFVFPILASHVIPSFLRDVKVEPLGRAWDIRDSISLGAGVIGFAAEVAGYGYACYKGHPEALMIPVATNALSLVYEAGRCVYSRFSEKSP